MEEVALLVEELQSSTAVSHCRICHDAEFESSLSLEAPCACSGTVKYAHRDCIQRWCNEKGNTTCEICLQNFEPGYVAEPSKKLQMMESAVTIRDSLQVVRREHQLMADDEEESEADAECASVIYKFAAFCRTFTFSLTVFLIWTHVYDVLEGRPEEYPFTLPIVLLLRLLGIIAPMYVVICLISAIRDSVRNRRNNFVDEEGEDEEEISDRQRHHIV